MMEERTSGIILAGGRSVRMGRDKALLQVAGKPLVQHLAERMLALGLERLVIAGGTETRGQAYVQLLQGLPAEIVFVSDHYPACGPLAGLHAALSALPSGYGFVMACDMPVVSETLFHRMQQAAGEAGHLDGDNDEIPGEDSSLASPARSDTFPQLIRTAGQPFHALYHTSAARELERRLERSDLRVMPLLSELRSLQLEATAEEEAAFMNLNTPALYEQYLLRGNT